MPVYEGTESLGDRTEANGVTRITVARRIERVLVLTPTARDAALHSRPVVGRRRSDVEPCATFDEVMFEALSVGAACVLLPEETLTP